MQMNDVNHIMIQITLKSNEKIGTQDLEKHENDASIISMATLAWHIIMLYFAILGPISRPMKCQVVWILWNLMSSCSPSKSSHLA